jgi:DUF4097 and DUF4098 domain-containing protein YvlB
MNRREIINKILHDHIDVNRHEDYTNYKRLITAIEEWHESEVKELSIHSVSDFFSFARYLNEHFRYFDNTDVGNVYKDNDGQVLYSENDIYDEWLNNR